MLLEARLARVEIDAGHACLVDVAFVLAVRTGRAANGRRPSARADRWRAGTAAAGRCDSRAGRRARPRPSASLSFRAAPTPAKPPPRISDAAAPPLGSVDVFDRHCRGQRCAQPLEQVVADAQRVRHRRQRRVDRADAREDARVDDVEVVELVRLAVDVRAPRSPGRCRSGRCRPGGRSPRPGCRSSCRRSGGTGGPGPCRACRASTSASS